jgi:hypothetical protein
MHTTHKENAMYIARDKNNDLYLFSDLPERGNECWWAPMGVDGTYLRLDKSLHPEISWESEPQLAELSVVAPA